MKERPEGSGSTVTVVMPAYNEEEAIAAAVNDVRIHVLARIEGAELLVVNDGSTDRTGTILDEMAAVDPQVTVVHRQNGGHGPAIITGLNAVQNKYILLVDSDRQIPLSAFPKLWEAVQGGADAAFGVRRERHDPQTRLVITRVIRGALRVLFGVRLYDANVPFKLIQRQHWTQARPLIPDDTLAPSLFLAVWMKRRGVDIAELDVPHAERSTGEVSIKRWKLLRFCAVALGQLIVFRRRVAR